MTRMRDLNTSGKREDGGTVILSLNNLWLSSWDGWRSTLVHFVAYCFGWCPRESRQQGAHRVSACKTNQRSRLRCSKWAAALVVATRYSELSLETLFVRRILLP